MSIQKVGFTSSSINYSNAENLQQPKPKSAADTFLSGTAQETEKINKGTIIDRNLWSTTALLPILGGIMGYGIFGQKHKAFGRNLLLISGVGIALIAGLQHYFKKDTEKHLNDTKKYFDSINKTNAKLSPEIFVSGSKGAFYSPMSGEIYLNRTQLNDPISRYQNKRLLKHELVHAKQYETIARSKDGIKKINYICIKQLIDIINKNPHLKKEFEGVYNDVQNDKTGKYDNAQLTLPTGEAHFKNYITAVHIIINNPNATYNDLPVFINQKHYEEVIKKDGTLTPEEAEKADKYYDAALNYPQLTSWNMLNPFSPYYNNLLEKEAYKENPWYTRII